MYALFCFPPDVNFSFGGVGHLKLNCLISGFNYLVGFTLVQLIGIFRKVFDIEENDFILNNLTGIY